MFNNLIKTQSLNFKFKQAGSMLQKTNVFIFMVLISSISLASETNFSLVSDPDCPEDTSNKSNTPKPSKELYDKMYEIWNNCNFANWLRINNNDLYHSQYSCDNWETVKTVYQEWQEAQEVKFAKIFEEIRPENAPQQTLTASNFSLAVPASIEHNNQCPSDNLDHNSQTLPVAASLQPNIAQPQISDLIAIPTPTINKLQGRKINRQKIFLIMKDMQKLKAELANPKAAYLLIQALCALENKIFDLDVLKKIVPLTPKQSLEWINPETGQNIIHKTLTALYQYDEFFKIFACTGAQLNITTECPDPYPNSTILTGIVFMKFCTKYEKSNKFNAKNSAFHALEFCERYAQWYGDKPMNAHEPRFAELCTRIQDALNELPQIDQNKLTNKYPNFLNRFKAIQY